MYLIAKRRNDVGCLAFKVRDMDQLSGLKSELDKAVSFKGVQIVVISRPTAYGEYAPYTFVEDESEFETGVKAMV